MNIVIVGAGNVGHALGKAWKAAGQDVTFALRDASGDKAKALSKKGFKTLALANAAAKADVILLALPWTAIGEAIEALGALKGKIVIDATNPLTPDLELAMGFDDSAGETVAVLAEGARVVKAFNTTGADNMENPAAFKSKAAMMIAGDDAEAKKVVGTLAESIGFEAVDCGPLKMSRALEPLALVWIKLAYAQGRGTAFAFSMIKR